MKKKIILILGIVILLAMATLTMKVAIPFQFSDKNKVTNFDECAKAGNLIMESYPRQCKHKDTTFTELIGRQVNETDKSYKIVYGSSQQDLTIIKQDCQTRKGTFNDCGSMCPRGETCLTVCVNTCEDLKLI